MSLAPWRSPLARALYRNRSLVYARYLQLATVRSDGRPANRTIVFRGFLHESDRLKFITDARSQKPDQIEQSAWGEACWYFPKSREQFRLAGRLLLVQDSGDPLLQTARCATWQELSDASRTQFAWPHPGQPRRDGFDVPPPDPTTPPANFCLLLLEPEQVDHLELKGDPQNRCLYHLEAEAWSVQSVNP